MDEEPHQAEIVERALDQSPQSAINMDETKKRTKYLGPSSSQIFGQEVDIVLMAQGHNHRLSDGFQHGMRYCEEFNPPLGDPLPTLQVLGDFASAIDLFFERLQPLYPFVDRAFIDRIMQKALQQEDLVLRDIEDAPQLASLYSVISCGLIDLHGAPSPMSNRALEAAYSLLPRIIGHPYFESVQALGVLALAFSGCLREGMAWQMIGQAIRIAYSIGLHRRSSDSESSVEVNHRNVWWACYCFESHAQFDSGRPSMLDDDATDQLPPINDPDQPKVNFLGHLHGLCRIQRRIMMSIFGSRRAQNLHDMVAVIGDMDSKLTEWADSLPEFLRYPSYD